MTLKAPICRSEFHQKCAQYLGTLPGFTCHLVQGGGQMRPLRKNRPAALKEDKQVGDAVEVDVYDGALFFVRRGVEFLDQIDTVVEVAIRLAADEGVTIVVLVNIRAAVEVRVDRPFGQLALPILLAPDVDSPVPVLPPGADAARGWP